jgi:hypothetical protein
MKTMIDPAESARLYSTFALGLNFSVPRVIPDAASVLARLNFRN